MFATICGLVVATRRVLCRKWRRVIWHETCACFIFSSPPPMLINKAKSYSYEFYAGAHKSPALPCTTLSLSIVSLISRISLGRTFVFGPWPRWHTNLSKFNSEINKTKIDILNNHHCIRIDRERSRDREGLSFPLYIEIFEFPHSSVEIAKSFR